MQNKHRREEKKSVFPFCICSKVLFFPSTHSARAPHICEPYCVETKAHCMWLALVTQIHANYSHRERNFTLYKNLKLVKIYCFCGKMKSRKVDIDSSSRSNSIHTHTHRFRWCCCGTTTKNTCISAFTLPMVLGAFQAHTYCCFMQTRVYRARVVSRYKHTYVSAVNSYLCYYCIKYIKCSQSCFRIA